jgi:methionyl-tRNA formyltransferase
VWTIVDGKRVIIHKAHIEKISNLKSQISNLRLDIVQPEGKKPMTYEEYLKGNPRIS